ncbi:MAG TPA: hypothetical protein VGP17_06660 [Solirubrobacteraceae bacterium]|jgi:hypothetical protein|nr:hypothetical protein [Solirubrobacteraceae bacterium]
MSGFGGIPQRSVSSWPRLSEGILGFIAREEEPLHAAALWSLLLPRLRGIELPIGEVRAALRGLIAEGMIASVAAADDSEATYWVTVAGIEHRDAWLRSPLNPPYCREELLMRLAVASGPDDIRRLVDLVRSEERARVTEAMERQAVPEEIVLRARSGLPINDWRTRTKFLLHAAELEHCQAELHWLQQVRAVLREELDEHGVG